MNLWWRLVRMWIRSKRGARIGLWDTAVTPFRVALTDLDALRHMNNGRYLTLLDLGRMDLMMRSGFWAKAQELNWYPVVAGQTITYWKELNLGQAFEIHTRVVGTDGTWIFLEQDFRRGDRVHASATIRSCFIEKGHGRVDTARVVEAAGGTPPDLTPPEWMLDWTRESSRREKP